MQEHGRGFAFVAVALFVGAYDSQKRCNARNMVKVRVRKQYRVDFGFCVIKDLRNLLRFTAGIDHKPAIAVDDDIRVRAELARI